MIHMPCIAEVLIKLRLTDSLAASTTPKHSPTLNVNGKSIYHIVAWSEDRPPFTVKRTVRGTILKIPSMHDCYYTFENGKYDWERTQ